MDERERVPFYDRHTSAPWSRTHVSTRSRTACNRLTHGGEQRHARLSTVVHDPRTTGGACERALPLHSYHTQSPDRAGPCAGVRALLSTHTPQARWLRAQASQTESKALSRVRGRKTHSAQHRRPGDTIVANPTKLTLSSPLHRGCITLERAMGRPIKSARGGYYLIIRLRPTLRCRLSPGQSADAPTACPWPDLTTGAMGALRAALWLGPLPPPPPAALQRVLPHALLTM